MYRRFGATCRSRLLGSVFQKSEHLNIVVLADGYTFFARVFSVTCKVSRYCQSKLRERRTFLYDYLFIAFWKSRAFFVMFFSKLSGVLSHFRHFKKEAELRQFVCKLYQRDKLQGSYILT